MFTPISIASDESINAFVAYCRTVVAGTAPDPESPWHQIHMSPWAFICIHDHDDDPLECEGCQEVGGYIAWCVSGATLMLVDYEQTPFKDCTSSQQPFLEEMLNLAEGHENDTNLAEQIKALPSYKGALEGWGTERRELGWWDVNIFARSTGRRVFPEPPGSSVSDRQLAYLTKNARAADIELEKAVLVLADYKWATVAYSACKRRRFLKSAVAKVCELSTSAKEARVVGETLRAAKQPATPVEERVKSSHASKKHKFLRFSRRTG